MDKLICQRHGALSELANQWRQLASECNASLFTSWSWQSNWWQTWGGSCGLELHLYSVVDVSGKVVAIAPFFIREHRYAKGVTIKQLQIFGNCHPTDITVLSEYLDILVHPDYEDLVAVSISQLLEKLQWDECVLPYNTLNSFFCSKLIPRMKFVLQQITDYEGPGVLVDVSHDFHEYLTVLGKNTRLKLYNRRSLLQSIGQVELEYAGEDTIDEFLANLNALDTPRWGRVCFGPESLAFHSRVAHSFYREGALRLSCLKVNDEVVSVLYNICFKGVEYNIQSAYREDFHPKIALGTLHLGYSIERAFQDKSVNSFDLLFGAGKKSFYKKNYKGMEQSFYTIRLGRSYKSFFLYKAQQCYRRLKTLWSYFTGWKK